MKLDFQLLGTDILPSEISQRTGIKADTQLARGERNSTLILPRQNVWSLQSHVQSDDLGEHWAELEPVLIAAKNEIREIAKTGQAKLTLAIGNSERLPSLQIPPSMSAFAGFVAAVIDIDQLQ